MRRSFALDLYLVTDRTLCATLGIERVVGEAVAGGVTMVQLRDDRTAHGELVALARRLKVLLEPTGVPLIVNNRLDVAVASGADGLHIGQADIAPARARGELGDEALLGLSITAPGQLAAVDAHLATYDASGAVSGIDDRSIIAILVGAVKSIWEKVTALMQSDEAQNARIQRLEEEVAALKSQSAAAGVSVGGIQSIDPGSSSTPTTPAEPTTASNDNEPADEPAAAEPEADPPLELEPANNNFPAEELPATDTE